MAVRVRARDYWTDTEYDLEQNATYACEAAGWWVDLCVPCGPNGYDSKWFGQRRLESSRRLPTARWFALCGAI